MSVFNLNFVAGINGGTGTGGANEVSRLEDGPVSEALNVSLRYNQSLESFVLFSLRNEGGTGRGR